MRGIYRSTKYSLHNIPLMQRYGVHFAWLICWTVEFHVIWDALTLLSRQWKFHTSSPIVGYSYNQALCISAQENI